MELPIVHEIARSAKKPSVSPRSFTKQAAPPPPTTTPAANAVGTPGSRGGKVKLTTQVIHSARTNEAAPSKSISSSVKTTSVQSSRGSTPPSSASAPATKMSMKTTTKQPTSHFLKLATVRNSSGPKPKLPTKPSALKDSSRKPGSVTEIATPIPTTATASIDSPAITVSKPPVSGPIERKSSAFATSPDPLDQEKRTWFKPRCGDAKSPVQIAANRETSLHARLPSTDSGIQADSGFDSLSRYKGQSFLSDSSGTYDSIVGSDDVVSSFCVSPSSSSDTLVNDAGTGSRHVITDKTFNSHAMKKEHCQNEMNSIILRKANMATSGNSNTSGLNSDTQFGQGNGDANDTDSTSSTSLANSIQTTSSSPGHGRMMKSQTKRPFAAPRPVSSPPPVPSSAPPMSASTVASSEPATRRVTRSRPGMPPPAWRHSACLPSRTSDLHESGKDSPDSLSSSATLPRRISSKIFSQGTIKTLRSTSLENFGKIIGDALSPSKKHNITSQLSSTPASSKAIAENLASSQESTALPETTTRTCNAKSLTYMNVSPPPPPSLSSTSLSSSHSLQASQSPSAKITDSSPTYDTTRISKSSSNSSNTPKLHPSIKTFTSDGGVCVTFGKTPVDVFSPSSNITQKMAGSTKTDLEASNDSSRNCHSAISQDNKAGDTGKDKTTFSLHHAQGQGPLKKNDLSKGVSRQGKGESNVALTRPLRVVAPPGRLGVRAFQPPTTLSPKFQDFESSKSAIQGSRGAQFLKAAKDQDPSKTKMSSEQRMVSTQQSDCQEQQKYLQQSTKDQENYTDKPILPSAKPGSQTELSQQPLHQNQQPQQKTTTVKPTAAPRTHVTSSNTSTKNTNTTAPIYKPPNNNDNNQSFITANQSDSKSTPKIAAGSDPISSPTLIMTHSNLNSSSKSTSPGNKIDIKSNTSSPSKPTPMQRNAVTNRFEIPVTHVQKSEENSMRTLKKNSLTSGETLSPSTQILHRTTQINTNNSTSRRPVSSSFPRSSSPLSTSPSSYSSTLPKHSFGKRDMKSPFRTHLTPNYNTSGEKQKEAIYENVRTRIRESLRFDDASSRFKHADLILKESDELIKEAVEMLNNSSFPSSLSSATSSTSPTTQKFFSTPLSSFWRKDKYRYSSSPEGKECGKDLSAPTATSPSSPSSPNITITVERVSSQEEADCHKKEKFSSATSECEKNLENSRLTKEDKRYSIPIYDVKSGNFYSNTKNGTVIINNGNIDSKQEGEVTHQSKADVPWSERKARMDTALSWLKAELASLRDMDNTLIVQFKRCQDTIETLKTQRDVWEGLSEEGDEGEYWDDYEINEFNKKYLDSPGGSSCSQMSPGSRNSSLYDVTSASAPRLALPGERRGSLAEILNCSNGVTQNVEATL
ncbi:hypothetical protein PoB_007224400 [Plakobranchus ocellatus]|uniref:Uncharacterized protein n=1 Tax=Plakobranchus ocellatus TaxID=259542 RepID=A0AAV4DNK4_9GAST|nr:hypothetical protein PoB_007224400 [Plakobranchus ocellatus]